MNKIAVIGTGAWGTALSLSCLHAERDVTLYARHADFAHELQTTRYNRRYLPNIELPDSLRITADWASLNEADLVLLVTPAQKTQELSEKLRQSSLKPSTPIVICAKGIDLTHLHLLSETVRMILPNPLAVLSGPSFARDVAQNLPSAVIVAANSLALAMEISQSLRHPHFRCYASTDMIGCQIGGALKNVLAIACGVVRGRNLGDNASAALMTRGLAEMRRFGLALGGATDTFLGLAGVGDLILTGSSQQSRNFTLGFLLGQGQSLEDILNQRHSVTEGVATSAAVHQLSQKYNLHMPICQGIYQLLHQKNSVDAIIEQILSKQSDLEF
jgi:glycerol-3-phosphate dehydrogenase (NAD(P)+)